MGAAGCWFCLILGLPGLALATPNCTVCDGSESLSLRQLRGVKTSITTEAWSFKDPNPDLLRWDRIITEAVDSPSGQINRTTYNGWLSVPLVHDTALLQFEMPPFVCLRVRGIASQVQPARNGPILAHCGGPLTGRECAQDMSEVSFLDIDGQHEIISHFDLISIDQRGVLSTQDTYERQGKWGVPPPCPFEESGQALKPFPEVYCDEAAKHNLGSVKQVLEQLVTVGHNQSMEELARTYVLPIYLNRGIPVSVLTEGNESFVRWYYRLVRLEHSLCFEAPRYKIQAPNGRMYNTLQFAGTIDLAYDIDLLRQAIGAERMSLYGVSYGTSVAGVYATVFPQHTHRVVMDGALHPAPDAAVRGESFAFASQSFWDGIVRDCEASVLRNLSQEEVCPAAPEVALKAQKVLHGTNRTEANSLLLLIWAASYYESWAPLAMACIQQFFSGKDVPGCRELKSRKAVNLLQSLQSLRNAPDPGDPGFGSRGSHPDWQHALKDIVRSRNESTPVDRFLFGLPAVVMGTDTAGCLDEEELVTWWKRTKERAPIGIIWALDWMVAMVTWPVPPVGDASLEPVIIGNLHDPRTAYANAQELRQAFPEGYLVTWQGYGHGLKDSHTSQQGASILREYEKSRAENKLPEYTNAVAKYACISKVFHYLDTGEGIRDGHTCLLPEALNLGSARAVSKARELITWFSQRK